MGDEEKFKFHCQYQYLGTCYFCLLQKSDIEAYGVIICKIYHRVSEAADF